MPGVVGAGVEVPVILWQQVNVVKHEAAERGQLHGLQEPNVEQRRPVELSLPKTEALFQQTKIYKGYKQIKL